MRKQQTAAQKAAKAEYDHARVEQNREKKRLYDIEYGRKNRAKKAEYHRQYRKDHPEYMRDLWLRRTFNKTSVAWDAMFELQGRRCLLCGDSDPGTNGWQTDHDHACCPGTKSCGRCVRGILCWSCNTGLGHFKDGVELLRRAADFIEQKRKELYGNDLRFAQGKSDGT